MLPLIPKHEEEELFDKLMAYYKNLYPDVNFKKEETVLTPEEIGEIHYTFPGEESEVTFFEKVAAIKDAIKYGYDTPVILLRKRDKDVLLDGHRRLKVAWDRKMKWKAILLIPDKDVRFGIERMIMGKIKDIWRTG